MTRIPLLLAVVLGLGAVPANRAAPPEKAQQARPKLVVLLAVDQLATHLFDRYETAFTGGFRRILDEGFRYTNSAHFHANTETAAGHAALSTGVLPNRNGIVANSWSERVGEGWADVYAVADSTSPISGIPQLEGRSPANLLVTGLGDWMQSQDQRSRVVSISRKDRSAITLAGKTSNAHVYWLVPQAGRWVTSTYYRDAYSRWFEAWHRDQLPRIFKDSVWASSIPPELEHLARGDTAAYEGDGVHTYFPHRFVDEGNLESEQGLASWYSTTPLVDQATLSLAEEAVRRLDLGQDDVPDYLAVALSQTDIIGHGYGPYSREQLDNLLRLDRHLGDFLEFLDRYVGEGRWVLGFSADHGVLPMPEYLVETGEYGHRTTREEITAFVTEVRRSTEGGGTPDEVADRVKAAVETSDLIAAAYVASRLRSSDAPVDSFEVLFRNSYRPDRAAGLFGQLGVSVRPLEGVLVTTSATGTSHGSPYWYDRAVPFLLLGAGVPHGTSEVAARTIDMAPTLAALAGVPVPEGLDGVALVP